MRRTKRLELKYSARQRLSSSSPFHTQSPPLIFPLPFHPTLPTHSSHPDPMDRHSGLDRHAALTPIGPGPGSGAAHGLVPHVSWPLGERSDSIGSSNSSHSMDTIDAFTFFADPALIRANSIERSQSMDSCHSHSHSNSNSDAQLTLDQVILIARLHAGRLPSAGQLAPVRTHSVVQPIVNTGNQGPMVAQEGDWRCLACGYTNWRRRSVCHRCFPSASYLTTLIHAHQPSTQQSRPPPYSAVHGSGVSWTGPYGQGQFPNQSSPSEPPQPAGPSDRGPDRGMRGTLAGAFVVERVEVGKAPLRRRWRPAD